MGKRLVAANDLDGLNVNEYVNDLIEETDRLKLDAKRMASIRGDKIYGDKNGSLVIVEDGVPTALMRSVRGRISVTRLKLLQ